MKSETAEITLIQQVLNGRRECYRPLVEKYQPKVYHLAISMIHDAAEAQDIAQEVFLTAYRKLKDLKDLNKFSSWLYGITRNLSYAKLREKKIEPESLDEIQEQQRFSNVVNMFSSVVSMVSPSENNDHLQQTLIAKLDRLPEKYQTLLRLKYLEDYSYQEISELLDLPVELVRSRLFEGRRILREGVLKTWSVKNDR